MKNDFARTSRLTTDAQFRHVFLTASKIKSELCAIFFCNNNLGHPRLGVVVPKKSIKMANRRNCFKRIVRESFRLKQHQLGSFDIIVLSYRNTTNVFKEKLCQQLESYWAKLSL